VVVGQFGLLVYVVVAAASVFVGVVDAALIVPVIHICFYDVAVVVVGGPSVMLMMLLLLFLWLLLFLDLMVIFYFLMLLL
jgi:hypothetical protein